MKNFVVEDSSYPNGESALSTSMGLYPLVSLNFKCVGYTIPKISTSWSKGEVFSTVSVYPAHNFNFCMRKD